MRAKLLFLTVGEAIAIRIGVRVAAPIPGGVGHQWVGTRIVFVERSQTIAIRILPTTVRHDVAEVKHLPPIRDVIVIQIHGGPGHGRLHRRMRHKRHAANQFRRMRPVVP